MEELIKNTSAYLNYLIGEMKLYVSVHFIGEQCPKINGSVMIAISPYTIHRNPYCQFVTNETHSLCVENQRNMILGFKSRSAVLHECYAGTRELAYPIFKGGEPVGYVAVSGYRGQCALEPFDAGLWQSALDPSEPPKQLTDVIIPPLQHMLERLLEFEADDTEEINLILRYISDRPKSASLDDIARHFGRSRSYVSHLFKSKTGSSIRAYCNGLKLVTAQNMLKSSELSVTEIALEAGFDDTSYFVRLFREKYGTTPHKYRKSHLTS